MTQEAQWWDKDDQTLVMETAVGFGAEVAVTSRAYIVSCKEARVLVPRIIPPSNLPGYAILYGAGARDQLAYMVGDLHTPSAKSSLKRKTERVLAALRSICTATEYATHAHTIEFIGHLPNGCLCGFNMPRVADKRLEASRLLTVLHYMEYLGRKSIQ